MFKIGCVKKKKSQKFGCKFFTFSPITFPNKKCPTKIMKEITSRELIFEYLAELIFALEQDFRQEIFEFFVWAFNIYFFFKCEKKNDKINFDFKVKSRREKNYIFGNSFYARLTLKNAKISSLKVAEVLERFK